MEEIKVLCYYRGLPYHLEAELFSSKSIEKKIVDLRERYSLFREDILAQGGYIILNISHAQEHPQGVAFDHILTGIYPPLIGAINLHFLQQ